MQMEVYPRGVIVLVAFCGLLIAALSNPAWKAIAEAAATVFIVLSIAGFFFPSLLRKSRGL